MATSSPEKLAREKRRYERLTPAQRAKVMEDTRLRMEHRRRTDVAYLAKCRDTVRQQYAKHRATRIEAMREKCWQTRLRCLRAYSGNTPCCTCCREETLEFLTLDHLDDRRRDSGVRVGGDRVGQNLYAWLIRMNFPPGFRVLCFNCNCARGNRGYCPHELALAEEIERVAV
jgi:hypothetical protein